MGAEQDQAAPPKLLRKPAAGEAPDNNDPKTNKRGKKPEGSRFVGPAQLDERQRSQLRRAMKRKKIGDDTGRDIFIGALAYQISTFDTQLQRSVTPRSKTAASSSAPQEPLQAIVGNTAGLSALLRALPEDAKARLSEIMAAEGAQERVSGERYIDELALEIDQLGRACIALASGSDFPTPTREPKADKAANRKFVAKLAESFSACFEMEPTAEEDGPFHTSLDILREVTGLAIEHDPAFLAQVLASKSPDP